MLSNNSTRLLSAALIDKEQLEESERSKRHSSAFLFQPVAPSTRCQSAPDPVTEGFFGTNLFSKLLLRQQSSSRYRNEHIGVSLRYFIKG